MIECTVITGLVTEIIPIYNMDEFMINANTFEKEYVKQVGDRFMDIKNRKCKTEVEYIQPHELFTNHGHMTTSMCVAYTKEVQNLLEMPFNTILYEMEDARKEATYNKRWANSIQSTLREEQALRKLSEVEKGAIVEKFNEFQGRFKFYTVATWLIFIIAFIGVI